MKEIKIQIKDCNCGGVVFYERYNSSKIKEFNLVELTGIAHCDKCNKEFEYKITYPINLLEFEDCKVEEIIPEYIPTCKYGYDDCIGDPAYLEKYYGRKDTNCDGCYDGSWYDDEDK